MTRFRSRRTTGLVQSDIRYMSRECHRAGGINLGQGICDMPTPDLVRDAAIQAIGCLGMRACHTNNCPVGIAPQRESLRARLIIDESATRLNLFFRASVELMQVLARACVEAEATPDVHAI